MKRIAWAIVGLPLEMLATPLGTAGLLCLCIIIALACGLGCRAAAPDATIGTVTATRDATVASTSAGLFTYYSAFGVGVTIVFVALVVAFCWDKYLSHVRSVHKTDALANSRPVDEGTDDA